MQHSIFNLTSLKKKEDFFVVFCFCFWWVFFFCVFLAASFDLHLAFCVMSMCKRLQWWEGHGSCRVSAAHAGGCEPLGLSELNLWPNEVMGQECQF